MDAFRTPDERFGDLPGFPYEPHYREWNGLRLAHIDEGEGRPVVFFHGEPTWSYLWRKVTPPVLDAGYRAIAPDYPGFGRSDKPTEMEWYSYDQHTEAIAPLLEELDLRDAVAVVHDWGGPIGMRLFTEHRDRFSALVIMDTGLFTGEQPMTEAWQHFRDFVERTEDLPISMLVAGAVARGMEDDVKAAYDAPFPQPESKAGARAFPLMLPTSPDMPGAEAGRKVRDALVEDERPKLLLWADSDPIIPPKVAAKFAELLGAAEPELIENASHFLQEDAGEEIGTRIAAWLDSGEAG
ncbi:haloalkane dehalogenase [soil metagenome]